jgi:uncharacterized membrane protein
MIFAVIALFATGLFAGAALYISVVEHPARMECGTELAATEFGPSYRRASVMQAGLAAVGLLAGSAAWLSLNHVALLIGSVLIGAVIPFTLVVIVPTNKQLLAPTLDKSSHRTAELLARWQRLHAVRTALSVAAFAVLLWCTLQCR